MYHLHFITLVWLWLITRLAWRYFSCVFVKFFLVALLSVCLQTFLYVRACYTVRQSCSDLDSSISCLFVNRDAEKHRELLVPLVQMKGSLHNFDFFYRWCARCQAIFIAIQGWEHQRCAMLRYSRARSTSNCIWFRMLLLPDGSLISIRMSSGICSLCFSVLSQPAYFSVTTSWLLGS